MGISLYALNKALKAYDRNLYAKAVGDNGLICVFTKKKRWDDFDYEGDTYRWLNDEEQLVCSLTDTWGSMGRPTDWGIEPVIAHLRAIDLFNRDDIFDSLMKDQERVAESKERDFRNSTESFLLEYRDAFKKDFADVRTANMDMSKDSRRKFEKRRLNNGIS